jgi:putative NADH-flavin reductase
MSLKDKTVVVTGGSRGLGLGLVEALVSRGARVTVVARDQAALAAGEQRLGVAVIPADVTDEGAAQRILTDVRPEVLVLNAGATPRMGRLDQLSWADFTAPWETDVKAGLYWMQAALNLPLAPGKRMRSRGPHPTGSRSPARSECRSLGAFDQQAGPNRLRRGAHGARRRRDRHRAGGGLPAKRRRGALRRPRLNAMDFRRSRMAVGPLACIRSLGRRCASGIAEHARSKL